MADQPGTPEQRPVDPGYLQHMLKVWEICQDQERAIKDEENGWVRNYWVFYAAICTFEALLARALVTAMSSGGEPAVAQSDRFLPFAGLMLLSLGATILFQDQLLKMRWTYYDVRSRLTSAIYALGMDVDLRWGDRYPAMPKSAVLPPAGRYSDEQYKKTKPESTFLGRNLYLLVGHLGVVIVGASGAAMVGGSFRGVSPDVLALCAFALNAVILAGTTYWVAKRDRKRFLVVPRS